MKELLQHLIRAGSTSDKGERGSAETLSGHFQQAGGKAVNVPDRQQIILKLLT